MFKQLMIFSIEKESYLRACGHLRRNMNSLVGQANGDNNKPVESSIRSKLEEGLEPNFIQVVNESYMHNVPKGSETHFKVVVVSEKFAGQPLIKRHRMVNELLRNELQTSVHALSIVAKTPEQWQESSKLVEPSPACRGGFGK
ncbi:DNA-binding transcriptional regulator BolA isoform X1 [Neodiprion virginianus]|uniref:DNA-binding transcriptional regulator BolA isoform X1 n=1 Tax=Neodiprion virginianus TaxID=2961670 RepID=UPI001EE778D0|nr:DNA-binding transcriptional regulator BolA isoform X1 [Neodiprion virginianus]